MREVKLILYECEVCGYTDFDKDRCKEHERQCLESQKNKKDIQEVMSEFENIILYL